MEHNWLLALFNVEAQEDIFGRQPYIIAPGALTPGGRAERVEGGYRVSGRWQWGTGVMHADWVLVGVLTPGEDPEQPDLCMFAIPMADVTVIDTWNVAGMVGTGSNDIEVKDVFVPSHRQQKVADMRDGSSAGAAWHDSPIYRMPMLPVLALTAAAPAVGAAKQAAELFEARVRERTVYGSTSKQSEKAVAQTRLGHAFASVRDAEVQLMQIAREVSAWGHTEDACPELERAQLRLRIAHAVKAARDVVRDVLEASGASAHFLDNPLQRIHRDIHTLSGHTVFDLDAGGELYGRLLLGLSANSLV